MNIALIGYGKMGKTIESVALSRGHQIVLRIDLDNPSAWEQLKPEYADVAIEFTGPHSAFENVEKCLKHGVPVVCGSTGWLHQYGEIIELCTELNGSFLYASNFSVGVNIFFELNRKLADLMVSHPEYDVSLREIHHTQKKDAPSGTAITLAEQVMERIRSKTSWVNRPADNPTELSVMSDRIDPAPGIHHVKYHSVIDDIEIIHTAHSRNGFAFGAVLAAEYLADNKGIFSMQDVLGFSNQD